MSTPVVVTSPAGLWEQPLRTEADYRLRVTYSSAGSPLVPDQGGYSVSQTTPQAASLPKGRPDRVLDVPITVFTGASPGPRVALIAGIHGDEVEGPFALQYLARTLARDQLSGMLVMVLCANPTAMAQGQRLTPEDGQDLNRVFPGDPRGSVSHRLAAALFGLVREADFLMTLHSWYSSGEVLPYVEYPIAGSAAAAAGAAAARACGLERIMPCDWHPGLLPAAADRIGIPAIEVEIGGLGQRTQHGQEIYATVLLRFLRHAGILPSVPDVPSPARTIGGQHLTAQASGLLCLDVKLGEQVQSGQRLGAIMNLERRTQAEVIAPTEGEIGALRRFAPVRALDHVATIFQSAIH